MTRDRVINNAILSDSMISSLASRLDFMFSENKHPRIVDGNSKMKKKKLNPKFIRLSVTLANIPPFFLSILSYSMPEIMAIS